MEVIFVRYFKRGEGLKVSYRFFEKLCILEVFRFNREKSFGEIMF